MARCDNIRDLIHKLGGLNTTVLYEENSRNTYENAVNSRQVSPLSQARIDLITSANHMPRAVGSFAAAGWTGIIPYPVDYQTPKPDTSSWNMAGISIFRQSLHEYTICWCTTHGSEYSLLPFNCRPRVINPIKIT